MDQADLETIGDASTDKFRLETLPTYLVPEEVDEFESWRRGNRAVPRVEDTQWLRAIRDTTRAGVRWWRVRILDYPLTAYSEFELHGYQANARAGEDIYIADRAWHRELVGLREDFWVFDDTVIRMVYDDAGHFVRPELVDDQAPYLGMRAIALAHSVPLAEYLNRNEPRLIA